MKNRIVDFILALLRCIFGIVWLTFTMVAIVAVIVAGVALFTFMFGEVCVGAQHLVELLGGIFIC